MIDQQHLILALDPGTTTGIAYGVVDHEFHVQFNAFQVTPDEQSTPHLYLAELLRNLQPTKLLYEAFHFRQDKTGAVFTGVEYIGIIELVAQELDIPCIKVSPAQGKGFWHNNKIQALDLWKKGTPHGMDAMRILLSHIMMTIPIWRTEILLKLKEKLDA